MSDKKMKIQYETEWIGDGYENWFKTECRFRKYIGVGGPFCRKCKWYIKSYGNQHGQFVLCARRESKQEVKS